MRITRFAVSGFKNFTQEVILDELGEICVIHGENNVGKSNLLEAMSLFFKLESELLYENKNSRNRIIHILKELGFEPTSIFHLVSQSLVKLQTTFSITPEEIEVLGAVLLHPSFQSVRKQECEVSVEIQIAPMAVSITQQLDNPMERWFTQRDSQQIHASGLNTLVLDLLYKNRYRPIREKFDERFMLVGTDRRVSFDEVDAVREIVPQSLRLQLYDIKESFELIIAKRWKLFVKTMSRFNDILGEGEFVALFKSLDSC